MGFLDLFSAASMPVLKVLIVTAIGSFLALDSINILGQSSRKHVNELVFFVFNPALVGSNLAKTITYESLISLWFMPVNILLTFIIGSVLGWLLILIAKPPKHLKGLVLGTCSAGNLGNMLLIIVPAVCKEKGTPFGDSDVCSEYGMAYASLSMAVCITITTCSFLIKLMGGTRGMGGSSGVLGFPEPPRFETIWKKNSGNFV
ncbi:putative membrane transport protein [Helianthus annuus]|nr:putative membrane transport protein [Helianthus annuus]